MHRFLLSVFTILFCCPVISEATAQTALPILKLEGNFSTSYTKGKLTFVDTNNTKNEYIILAKYRGSRALMYDKKSFSIKVIDEQNANKDVAFLGMRMDNGWILDAMSNDAARMRNRVSFDLWNDFSTSSYITKNYVPSAKNGTRGRFVEVYINDKYNGLYCLNEKLDRKQLGIRKMKNGKARGALYKGNDWGVTQFWEQLETYDNKSSICEAWESAYPDVEDDSTANWEPLYNVTTFIVESSKDEFLNNIELRVDLPVWNDNYIFLLTIGAVDNGGRNTLTYIYDGTQNDKRIGYAPWDLDASWGNYFDGSHIDANFNRGITNNIYRKLFLYRENYLAELSSRYSDLRQNFLSSANLKSYFSKYFDLFKTTGAADRETAKWSGNPIVLDFDKEHAFIMDWIDKRLAWTDALFGYTPSGITSASYEKQRTALNDAIFDISGRRIESLTKGNIYIKNGKRFIAQ